MIIDLKLNVMLSDINNELQIASSEHC